MLVMDKLASMTLHGMAEALQRWVERPKTKDLTPLNLVGLVADAEWNHRESKRLTARLRNARFRPEARIEDIDYQHARGLTKAVMLDLAAPPGRRESERHLHGPDARRKSYLACAIGHKACREGFTVAYRRTSRVLGRDRPGSGRRIALPAAPKAREDGRAHPR